MLLRSSSNHSSMCHLCEIFVTIPLRMPTWRRFRLEQYFIFPSNRKKKASAAKSDWWKWFIIVMATVLSYLFFMQMPIFSIINVQSDLYSLSLSHSLTLSLAPPSLFHSLSLSLILSRSLFMLEDGDLPTRQSSSFWVIVGDFLHQNCGWLHNCIRPRIPPY